MNTIFPILCFFLLQFIGIYAKEESTDLINTVPAFFFSYSLIAGLKPSLVHNEQIPFTDNEANLLLSRALEHCSSDRYLFVKIPGLRVDDFQNFATWHNVRRHLTKASTFLSMPNIVDQHKNHDTSDSLIDWGKLEHILKTECHVERTDVNHMDPEEYPKYIDTQNRLIVINASDDLTRIDDIEEREMFLDEVNTLIQQISKKFPSHRISMLIGGTTSTETDYNIISDKSDIVRFEDLPDDPNDLSAVLREKTKISNRFIFPDITVFDKTRYFEIERNDIGERHMLSDLKENQWAKDVGKDPKDVEKSPKHVSDDTWLSRKDKVIKKEKSLYKFGENEIFHSVFENRQFLIDNALWLVPGVLFLVLFIAIDCIKLIFRATYRISKGKRIDLDSTKSKKE